MFLTISIASSPDSALETNSPSLNSLRRWSSSTMVMIGSVMLTETEIKAHVAQFLNGSLSIDDFNTWLTRASWNMHLSASARVQEVVGTVELCLAEFSLGHLREDEFRKELRAILDPPIVNLRFWTVGHADREYSTLSSEEEPKTNTSGVYAMSLSMAPDPDGYYVPVIPDAVTVLQVAQLRIPQTSQPHRLDRYNMSKPQTPAIRIR